MSQLADRAAMRRLAAGLLAVTALATGCSSKLIDSAPPTIETASAGQSPPVATAPSGQIIALRGSPRAAVVNGGSLVVLTSGTAGAADPSMEQPATVTVIGGSSAPRTVPLPGPATALAAGGNGSVVAATRGGFFTVDLAGETATRTAIDGAADVDFTAITRRADGRLVLGSADGSVYTLTPDNRVAAKDSAFARVDALVAQGNTAVVLDRAQTSVTALNDDGSPGLALRAGLGATTMAADSMGRVLVTDTRGGQLLVFGVDPLIERQAYPVSGTPYGVTGSATLVWVASPEVNAVVGYDLATGIPVEKVRYPTVRQPDALAFDDATGTLYVVSGSGDGVQVIRDAVGGGR